MLFPYLSVIVDTEVSTEPGFCEWICSVYRPRKQWLDSKQRHSKLRIVLPVITNKEF
jgi:hypothetical protein